MRIITEISGSLENKIVYEEGGKAGLFVLPSAIYTLDETRKRFYELHSERKPASELKEEPAVSADAEDDLKGEVQKEPVSSSSASVQRRKMKGKE